MDRLSTKAEFAHGVTESRRIMAQMRAEVRANCYAIDESRKAIDDTRDILDRPGDGDGDGDGYFFAYGWR